MCQETRVLGQHLNSCPTSWHRRGEREAVSPEVTTQNIWNVFDIQPKGKTSQSCCEALPILLITWVLRLCMGGGDPLTLRVFVLFSTQRNCFLLLKCLENSGDMK